MTKMGKIGYGIRRDAKLSEEEREDNKDQSPDCETEIWDSRAVIMFRGPKLHMLGPHYAKEIWDYEPQG